MSRKPIPELPPNDPALGPWEALPHGNLAALAHALYTLATGSDSLPWMRARADFLVGALLSTDDMVELRRKRRNDVP